MSWISSSLSPYRSGDLDGEIGEMLLEDHEMVCKGIQSRGLTFLIAYILIMALSVVKVIFHIFDYCSKPERPKPQITRENVDRGKDLSYLYEMKEARNCNEPQYKTKNREAKVSATMKLRSYLYGHNLELQGYILKEVNHKVDDHAFISSIISGEEMAKFTTTYITFGEEIDKWLYEILPTKPKKRTVQGTSCLAFENDYGFMAEELRQLYQEPIKVKFDNV